MYDSEKTGLEFIEGFALAMGLLWVGGALLGLIVIAIGRGAF